MTEPDKTPPREPPLLEGAAEPQPRPEPQSQPWAAPPPPPPTSLGSDPQAPGGEPAAPHPRTRLFLWLGVAACIILAASQAALWVRVLEPPPGAASVDPRVAALETRVTTLEQRAAPDLGPLTARVIALEQKPAANGADQRAPALEARITRLEQSQLAASAASPSTDKPTTDKPTTDKPTTDKPSSDSGALPRPPDLAPLEARIAALEQKTSAASAAATSAVSADETLAPRLSADETRLASLEKATSGTGQLADRANRIAHVQAAFVALSLGQPLGALPGAPPALARYATTAPPTEASLRLAFPAAAQAALAADHPASEGKPVLERLWAEAQDLVTVREGEHVLVGDPAAGVLVHARTALDAGDLAGAVAAVATLTGPAVQAMAAWVDQARALLAARAALAELAAQT